MSMFGNLLRKIFPQNHPAVAKESTQTAQAPQTTPGAAPTRSAPQPGPSANTGVTPAPGQPAAAPAPAAAVMPQVDVEKILDEKAQSAGQKLNWRTSIVDLMKLLDLDSSFSARKELAAELGFKGDTSDSAGMNIWLHRQVMNKLAANGGKVPAGLQD